jgi:phage gp16-like protein
MTDPRRADLAKIHLAAKALRMDDETYRGMLRQVAGVESAAALSPTGRGKVLAHLKRLGWTPRRRAVHNATDWRRPRIAKITAIWCALADAGVVRNRSEQAMVTWCANITRKPKLEWASSVDLNRCVEGLKSWARREAVKLAAELDD